MNQIDTHNKLGRTETILTKAKEFNLDELRTPMIEDINDGQLTIFSIWINGSLTNIEYSYNGGYKDKETAALADYILSLVEN